MLAGLTAAFPAALVLAALVPVLWWLHRARPHGEPLEVSSVLLFRTERVPQQSVEPRAAERVDSAWIRRSLLVLALAGSLAGLHILTRTPSVIVWIDGSPSMQTREQGASATRLQAALTELDHELAGRGVTVVALRSLARPRFQLRVRVPFDVRRVAEQMPAGPPILPEPAALDPSVEHWLVTDGASDALLSWLSTAPVAHLVQSGTLTENTAVTLLAYRPSLAGNACGDVIVTVYNAGLASTRRRLDLTAPTCPVTGSPPSAQQSSTDLTLQAGEARTLHFTVGPPPFRIAAHLSPADALPDDDVLVLIVTEPLVARVSVDRSCGRALEAAVQADPAVLTVPVRDAQMLVDCSFRWRGSRLPRLVLRPASGEAALRASYPLQIAALLDATAGEVLTERIARAARVPGETRIAPDAAALARWQRAHHGSRAPIESNSTSDLTRVMLILAVLLAVWELAAAARSLTAVRRYYTGAAP